MSGDPNAPVKLPQRCGTCRSFKRYAASALNPRGARFGQCLRWDGIRRVGSSSEKDPADRGPVGTSLGDEFGCVFWSER